jgi:Tol biopolymer transport system component
MNGRLKMQRVPQSNKLGYYLEPDANRAAAVYTVDVESQQKEILLNQATGLDVSWSPDGQKMVFNKIGATGQLELYLADGSGHDAKRLETATYVTKLAWSHDSRYLYLAVPRNMPAVNDFYKKGAKTEDILWQLDLETGEKIFAFDSRYGDVQRKVDAREMILAPNGDLLFFKNAHDQSIYVANLKRLRADQVNGFPAFIE